MALAIGLLIGVERHWHERDEAAGQRTAGVRSFGTCGLLGGVAAAIGTESEPGGWAGLLLVGLCFLGLSAAMIVFKDREGRAEGSFSVTSVLVAQATFLLGALAVFGDLRVAAAAAVALTAMLASREALHGLVAKLSWQELRSAILLLSMTLVIMPLIPDQRLSVLGGLNPHRIWSFAIVLAAVSFAGYAAVRVFGASLGLLVAGAAAGLTSSTASVLMNARAARTGAPSMLAAGALVASGVSYVRTALIAGGLAPELGRRILLPLLAAAAAKAIAAVLLVRRGEAKPPSPQRGGNPFELLSVLKLAILLSAVVLISEGASRYFGDKGLLGVALISGLVDVDAVTLSATALVPDRITYGIAASAVLLAMLSNTIAKAGYAMWFGGLRFGASYGLGSAVAVAAGLVVMLGLRMV
ncbi:MAG TPA: DUF4010 domain-containing protein [Acetobacteraceae bacterium]